jgi:histidinol phosphatase-like enzyme (inositol monophosphatase family)
MNRLEVTAELAERTAQVALSYFGRGLAVENKADGSPVTVADRAAEAAARAFVREHFPDDGFVGEEGGIERPEAARRWIVDPIDGTKAFVRSVPLWGTLVALAEGDTIVAGACVLPALGERVVAARGEGTFWNGARARVSTVASLAAATVLCTDVARLPASVRGVLDGAAIARTWGDCYGHVLVATGRAEAMLDPVLAAWDAAALLPIVDEAGGTAVAFDGRRSAFAGSLCSINAALAGVLLPQLAGATAVVAPALRVDDVDFSKGLVPVVAQDVHSGAVLMVAYTDAEALAATLATGVMHYHSRRRGLWQKGATSGCTQRVVSIVRDCDRDALLARVEQTGPACHTGSASCFAGPHGDELSTLAATIAERTLAVDTPGDTAGYTRRLLGDRNLRLKKLGEEAAELVLALADGDGPRAVDEAADVVYHVLVALAANGRSLADVRQALARRRSVASH